MEFLPSLPVLSAFTLASLLLTLSPGADMALFLGRALTQGRAAGMAALFGAMSGLVVHTILATLGISILIKASPTGFTILKICGALYLLWLAFQAIKHGSALSLKQGKETKVSFFNNWITGLGINLLNPKIIFFFITFLPQFIGADDPYANEKILFLGIYFVLFATVSCSCMVLAVDYMADGLKKNPKVIRIIDWLFAGVFSAFAIRILFTDRG